MIASCGPPGVGVGPICAESARRALIGGSESARHTHVAVRLICRCGGPPCSADTTVRLPGWRDWPICSRDEPELIVEILLGSVPAPIPLIGTT